MTIALELGRHWTADEFMSADQAAFGPLWRYELVDGRIVGHAAPTAEHGAILAGLTGALARLLAGRPGGCRPEAGSAATPRTEQRDTARIPDVIIRCGETAIVSFEVVSPSEIRNWRARDEKRTHLQAVEGLVEIVELYQDDYAAHIYRRSAPDAWSFEAVGGRDAALRIACLNLEIPIADIYEFADLPARGEGS